jgi:SanA protein
MSGDNINDNYDEVSAMRDYAINLKVPEENIITDPYGLNTYDSMYRLKNIYDVKSS